MKSQNRAPTLADFIKSKAVEEWITRPVARAAKTTAKGFASLGDLANLPVNAARGFAGYEPLQSPSELVGNAFDEYTNGLTVPQNAFERGIDTAGEFVTSGGPFGMAGKAAPLLGKLGAQTPKELIGTTAAGAGFQAGREYDPESLAIPLATSLAAGKVATTSPKEKLASIVNINPNKVEAFKKAELQPTLSNISNSRPLGTAENLIAEIPFANSALKKITDNTRNTIEKLGEGLTQEQAGSFAQEGLRNYMGRGTELIGKLKSKVDSHIQPDEKIKIPNLLKVVEDKPKLFTEGRQIAFNKSPVGKKYNEILRTSRGTGIYPYNDLNDLRQEIDNAISTFGQYGSKEQASLKQLRNQIKTDVRAHLAETNPKALNDYDRYNKVTHQLSKKREDIIDGLLNDKTATETFRKIKNNLNVDAREAKTVLNSFRPEQKKIFSESLIRELGMTPQNDFRGTQLVTNFKKLEPHAQEVVLSSFTPKERDKFRGLMDAIGAIKETQALGNPSRTAYTAGIAGIAGSLMSGDVASAASTLAKVAGTTVAASSLFANPKFINWLADAKSLKNPQQFEQHIGQLSKLAKGNPELVPALNNFLKDLSKDESDEDLNSLSTEELKAMLGEEKNSEDLNLLTTEELKKMLNE